MRKNLLFLIFLFGLLIGAQKNEGLILQKKTFTALIPFGLNLVIYGFDEEQSITGQLVNVTQGTIHLKDIYADKIKTISIENAREIKSFENQKIIKILKLASEKVQKLQLLLLQV